MPAFDNKLFRPPTPIATVTVRHPEHELKALDVLMLIDTGVDATLIPSTAVASLGIFGTGEKYQLVAFDGSLSESEAV